ncbi:MAG: glycosyltransferase family 2 protein [Patescibacteria group bacterium]|nr:glycosyltransferase family 2 protein [Patescibacteria group bacterium]
MKLSVHLVVWNGAKYIPYLFDSLKKQSGKDWFLFIWDNKSTDGTVTAIQKELSDFSQPYRLEQSDVNLGFAPAHNKLIRATDSEYFLLLNQDMYLAPDCLEKMVKFLDEHPETAAVSPRLMKWNFSDIQNGLAGTFSPEVDAIGLKIFRHRRVVEWLTQATWPVKNLAEKNEVEVFGVSGAFPLFRRSQVKEVFFADGAMFDESYHSYKEDVDLAYRLTARGFKSFVLLDSVAYHDRAGAGTKEAHDPAAARNKKNQSSWVKYHSYKNHLATLYKNEYGQNLALDFLWILWYELKKFVYFLLFDRAVLAGLKEIWRARIDLKNKRAQIKKLRQINWRAMRRWWSL